MAQGTFDREQVVQIVEQVVAQAAPPSCVRALAALDRVTGQMREELSKTGPGHVLALLPNARAELEAIVQTTEEAANIIMEECEALQKIAGEEGNAAIARILEACSFQDLTGQRRTKIRRALDLAEERTQKIADVLRARFADLESLNPVHAGEEGGAGGADAALMNGPQLPGQGLSQEEIDKLLDGF